MPLEPSMIAGRHTRTTLAGSCATARRSTAQCSARPAATTALVRTAAPWRCLTQHAAEVASGEKWRRRGARAERVRARWAEAQLFCASELTSAQLKRQRRDQPDEHRARRRALGLTPARFVVLCNSQNHLPAHQSCSQHARLKAEQHFLRRSRLFRLALRAHGSRLTIRIRVCICIGCVFLLRPRRFASS